MAYYYGRSHTTWPNFLDDFGHYIINHLGYSPYDLPREKNIICEALKAHGETLIRQIDWHNGYSRAAMARVATICQMVIFDDKGGPEEDDKPKALRRHWYAWFKVNFSQPFADALGDYEINDQGVKEYKDLKWSGLLSQTYSWFVDRKDVTYRDLWVEDASRMIETTGDGLFSEANILICVEKDSLLSDFLEPAQAIGARAVYSGKGKSSKAAIEKVLRDVFGWRQPSERQYDYIDPFENEPLIILHISDHDYDGEAVIGPTFGEQAYRYTTNIKEARIGIIPHQLQDAGYNLQEKWYSVKVGNSGYVKWAKEKALFIATCEECPTKFVIAGTDDDQQIGCPQCNGKHQAIDIKKQTPHGFEVEAMKSRDYYGLIVDALFWVMDFEYIVDHLRDDCVADHWWAAEITVDKVLQKNDSYQKLQKEIDRLQDIANQFKDDTIAELTNLGEDQVSNWRDLEDNPTEDEMKSHVKHNSYTWRPFSINKRTRKLVEWLENERADELEEMKNQIIEW